MSNSFSLVKGEKKIRRSSGVGKKNKKISISLEFGKKHNPSKSYNKSRRNTLSLGKGRQKLELNLEP